MSATDAFETDLLELLFQNTNTGNIGDATGLRGSSTAGVFYISLHTADPTDAGSQTSNETSYSNYVRGNAAHQVARSGSGWTVSGNNCSNASAITSEQCGASGATLTHFGIGTASSGTGYLVFKGALDSSLAVSNGITPSFAANQLDINCD